MDIIAFLDKYGIPHHNDALFELAVTHPSCNGKQATKHQDYERLEFLGDSLVGFVTSYLCYKYHPEMNEGQMTNIKSSIVSSEGESRYCELIGLDECIKLDKDINKTINMQSVKENVFEAFIGALLLDDGHDYAIAYLEALLKEDVIKAKPEEKVSPKNRLQEAFQSEYKKPVSYKVIESHPDGSNPSFLVSVSFDGHEIGRGKGRNIKDAETEAAKDALSKLAMPIEK